MAIRATKIALALASRPAQPWGVVDLEDKDSAFVERAHAVADARGNIVVAYLTEKSSGTVPQPKYAIVRRAERPTPDTTAGTLLHLRGTNAGVNSVPVFWGFGLAKNGDADGAYLLMQPSSATYRVLKIHPNYETRLPELPPGLFDASLAVDTQDGRLRFLAAQRQQTTTTTTDTMVYFELQGAAYSAYVPLGQGRAPLLLPGRNGKSLAVWWKMPGKRLVARWIDGAADRSR